MGDLVAFRTKAAQQDSNRQAHLNRAAIQIRTATAGLNRADARALLTGAAARLR